MESGQALLVQRANGKVQTLRDFLDIDQPFSLSKQSFFLFRADIGGLYFSI